MPPRRIKPTPAQIQRALDAQRPLGSPPIVLGKPGRDLFDTTRLSSDQPKDGDR